MKEAAISNYWIVFIILYNWTHLCNAEMERIDAKLSRIWGPGLRPDLITLPARYFFIQAIDKNNNSYTDSLGQSFVVNIEGKAHSVSSRSCRIWTNILDRKDGSYIVRYKLYEPCYDVIISVKYQDEHVAESPYHILGLVYPEACNCPKGSLQEMIETWDCQLQNQLIKDLEQFPVIDWAQLRDKVISQFDLPHSVSICHYVIRNNELYRKCYGKYVGFKMFMDAVLLSLTKKTRLPDMEFFVNLGDWPLASHKLPEKFPIFSWCGSEDAYDIVMPTYDISQSSLEGMGSVTLDMLSVQGNVADVWENRMPKVFWRGRDSSKHRLDLIDIARKHPELFNVSLTNFFFFRDDEAKYGPKTEHVSFFSFFDYKYQLGMDGTVAAYRLPYLLAGGSLLFKQQSKYYEHFYNELEPDVHYVPIERDLSDLVEKVKWAIEHDDEAKTIAREGQKFANDNLLPRDVLCYYSQLLQEFSKKIISNVEVMEGMEKVQHDEKSNCDCSGTTVKDEL